MAENKTKPNDLSVEHFLENLEDPVKKEDSKTIAAMMEELTGNRT